MNVDDFLKEYEKIKNPTQQTQKKSDNKQSQSMSVDDFMKQYQQIKENSRKEFKQQTNLPQLKTVEEANQYYKNNFVGPIKPNEKEMALKNDIKKALEFQNKFIQTGNKIAESNSKKKTLLDTIFPSSTSLDKVIFGDNPEEAMKKDREDAKESIDLLKVPESWKDNNRRFEDGYQFGDFTKTVLENAKESAQAVGSTAAEIPVRAARDFLGVAENASNFIASRIADVNDLQAALVSKIPGTEKYTDTLKSMTNNLRKEVAKGSPFAKQDKWIEDVADYLDRDSFTGKTADMVSGGLGQILAYTSIGSVLGEAGNVQIKIGNKVLNAPLVAFMTGGGSQDVKNYQMAEQQLGGIENATGLEKAIMSFRSILGGGIESFSEGMFGLFGVGGNEITDQWRNQAIAKANTAFEKWLASFVVAGGGEAIEEVASYVGNYVVDKILDTLNKKADGRLDFSTEFNWDEMLGEAFSAFLSSGISMGGSSAIRINNITKANQQLYEYQTGKQLNKTQLEQVRKSVADQVLKAQNELDNLKKMYPAEARKQDLSQVRESLRNFGGKAQQSVQEQQTNETQQVPSSQNKVQQNEPQSANSALKTSQIDTQNAQNIIQGLEEYSEDELKNMIADHVEQVTEGNVKLKDVSIQDGKATITYDSDLTEDLMEQALNTEPLNIDGVEVRITPVKYENSPFELRTEKDYDRAIEAIEEWKSDIENKNIKYGEVTNQNNPNFGDYLELKKQIREIIGNSISDQKIENMIADVFQNTTKYNENAVDINSKNGYNVISEPKRGYAPVNTTGWETTDDGIILHEGKEVDMPYELIPYVQENPTKGAYMVYTTLEDFFELPLEEMKSAVEGISGVASKLATKGEQTGYYNNSKYSFMFDIIEGTPNFKITSVEDLEGSDILDGIEEPTTEYSKDTRNEEKRGSKLQNRNIGKNKDRGTSKKNVRLATKESSSNDKSNSKENIDNLKNSKQGSFSLEKNDKQSKVLNVKEGKYEKQKSNKPVVQGHRIWDGFQETGYIDVIGKTIKSYKDVADLAQIFRNPLYETLRILYIKDGKVVGMEAITSKTAGLIRTEFDTKSIEKVKDRMKRLGADGYYMIHNHPSGNAVASDGDIEATSKWRSYVPGFQGHVIVDHGTYAFIDPNMYVFKDFKVDSSNSLYHGSQFQTALKSNKVPWNNMKINSREDVAALGHHVKNSKDYSCLILTDPQNKVNAIIDVPNKFFNMSKEQVEGYIRNVSKRYGASEAFIGTYDENAFKKMKNLDNIVDIVLIDSLFEKETGVPVRMKKNNNVFNDKTTKTIRLQEEKAGYDDENLVVRTVNKDKLNKLAKELGTSSNYIESNIEGMTNPLKSAKYFIANNTNIVDKYMKEKNISFPKKYKKVEFSRVKDEAMQKFVKDNSLTITKLANDEKLLDTFLDMWFNDLIEESTTENGKKYLEETKNKWKSLFEAVKETGNIAPALRIFDKEFEYINKGITEIEDDSQDWYNKRDIINSKEFNDYLDKKLEGLFDENVYDVDDVMEEAKMNHGTTNDYSTGAYMTTDGELLDFNYGGFRDDHRSISVYDMSMTNFMNYGAIRMQPESNGFELATEPTEAQYERLADYIDNYLAGDEINVDIDIGGKNNYDTATYKANTPSDVILDDIRYYFKNGHFPNKSKYAEFMEERAPYDINDGFYSQVEKVISTKMANKADAQTIKNLLSKNGAKQDELDWLDMDTFLASKDNFTKQEVLDYIKANQLQLEEVVKDDDTVRSAQDEKVRLEEDKRDIESQAQEILEKYGIDDSPHRIFHLSSTGMFDHDIDSWMNSYLSEEALGEGYPELENDRKEFKRLYEGWEGDNGQINMLPLDDDEYYNHDFDDSTKYRRYKTDLIDSDEDTFYREVLFTLPNFKGKEYTSPHWNDKNVVAHTRLQDYTDDSDNKVLFVEEIQSDLHQQGRRKGYLNKEQEKEITNLVKERDKLHEKINTTQNEINDIRKNEVQNYLKNKIEKEKHELIRYQKEIEEEIGTEKRGELLHAYAIQRGYKSDITDEVEANRIIQDIGRDNYYRWTKLQAGYEQLKKEETDVDYYSKRGQYYMIPKVSSLIEKNADYQEKSANLVNYNDELVELNNRIKGYSISNGMISSRFPFKKTWHEFVIRKIINEAVQNGYDKVAWTTGKQQNDRYNLSNYIDSIRYVRKDVSSRFNKNLEPVVAYDITAMKDGQIVLSKSKQTEKELEELIGKAATEKIINGGMAGELTGLDLEVGGEGMKGFYDKIIPDYVSKYIKKWGGKLEDVVINGNHQQGFTITPEMRKAVETEGQMLFEPRAPYDSETDEQRAERVRKYVEETQKAIGTLGSEVKRKDIVKSIIDNYGITTKGNSKVLNQVSKEIQDDIKQGKLTDEKIQKTAEDLVNNLYVTVDDFYKANKELKETIRQAKLYASDAVKNGFGDWNDYRKRAIGTVRLTNDTTALPVDTFYKELNEIYGNEFFPDDIVNISDQLERIVEVAKSIREIDMTLKDNIEQEFGEEARKEMVDGLVENLKAIRENAKNEPKEETDIPDVKQSSWTKTVQKNEMINKFIGEEELKNVKYVVKSNQASMSRANYRLETDGYDETLSYFDSVMKSGKIPSSEDIAVGERLIQESIKNGDFKTATRLIADTSILATELGQVIQATSMINRLSPAGQLMYLERAVRRINEQQRAKRKPQKKNGLKKVMDEGKVGDVDVKITDEMKESILAAQTPEELQRAVDRVKEQIAAQLPVTWQEKLTTLRYLSMLGNPKTHIRNILGNTMMIPLYEYKNFWQRVLETTFDDKLEERTATFKKASKAVNDYIDSIVDSTKEALSGSGYSNIQSELKNMRKIFKTKILQELNELNSNALEYEDFVFKKRVFKASLAEYLTANGIKTKEDIKNNQELIQKGINFAVEEAKKATFNQYNAVASAISRFENINGVTKVLTGGIVPFKRTPLNIAKTGWQYSPFGLAETLLWQTHNLKNGFITGNDYIERISQGLTGTSITLLGMLLASLGVLKGSTGSKKKDKYEESIGLTQPYSIRAGNKNVDVSWMSPSAIPLLVGAEFYSLLEEGLGWKTVDDIIQILEKSMNPISEMTMLKTLNDALINYGSSEDSVSGLNSLVDTVAKSYISQAFPTLGNQINKVIDPTIRSTAVSKNSKWKFGEQIARQNANKIIGLSTLLEPSTDIWGNVRKRSDYAVLRGLDAFANPANITKDTSTDVDHEIMSLYDANGNDDVIPKTPQKYFTANNEKYEMSASEYTQYKMTYGQTAYKNLEALFATDEYKSMSVEDSEKAISKVYSEAQEKAKLEFMINRYGEEGVTRLFDEKKINKLNKAKEQLGISYDQYMKAYYAQSGVEGEKGKDGKTISGTKKKNQIAAIQRALPTLSNAQATQLYKIYNGDL